MWKMRWKLISLTAALIAASSAQYQIIDNILVVQPDNVSSNHEDNGPLADPRHNSSYSPVDKDDLTLGTIHFNTDEDYNRNNNGIITPGIPPPRPPPNQEPRETGESTRPGETSESIQELSESEDSPEPPQTQSSEETTENPVGQETESSGDVDSEEPSTTEPPGSAEVTSVENETNEESSENDNTPPALRSSEEGMSSGQNSAQEGITVEEGVIQTTHGPVKGYRWPSNAEIMAYYDIPYGIFTEPFDTPDTAQSWLSVHEITEHTTICPQLDSDEFIGDTNCLTLSIFTPKDAENASVLFHVYDGYANQTSADPLVYGPDYLVPKGIIVVLPNYRIGPLGFLCMQNETALGNAGLKDLSLALEWVKENINSFGGNPSNIVVSGDGAAGAYAGYLAICARSKYYIDKVITESGSALSHWALDRDPVDTASELGEKIRANHSDGIIYNNTFAEASLESILRAAKGMRFKPCIENHPEPLIADTPWKILQDKDINTTFMIGSASYAGAHEAAATTADLVAQINEHFDVLLPEDLVFRNDAERLEFALKLREQYFGDDNITESDIEELSLWYTDASYLSPGIRLARPLLSAGATVYMYEFAFVGRLNRELEALHRLVPGAIRGDLTSYLFHKDGTSVEDDSPEKYMIELMLNLWTSFINTGKPAAPNIEWHELTKAEDEEEEWLLINSEPKMKKGIHLERLRLWTSIYEQYFIDNSGARHSPHYLVLGFLCLIGQKLNNNNQ